MEKMRKKSLSRPIDLRKNNGVFKGFTSNGRDRVCRLPSKTNPPAIGNLKFTTLQTLINKGIVRFLLFEKNALGTTWEQSNNLK